MTLVKGHKMKVLVILSFVGLAFPLGLMAPDVDQRVSFLVHRSILTHAPWFALLSTFMVVKSNTRYAMQFIGVAFNIGLVVHFALDLFPRAWMGFALIHIPVFGRLPPLASACWILASLAISVACVIYLGWRAIPREE